MFQNEVKNVKKRWNKLKQIPKKKKKILKQKKHIFS